MVGRKVNIIPMYIKPKNAHLEQNAKKKIAHFIIQNKIRGLFLIFFKKYSKINQIVFLNNIDRKLKKKNLKVLKQIPIVHNGNIINSNFFLLKNLINLLIFVKKKGCNITILLKIRN